MSTAFRLPWVRVWALHLVAVLSAFSAPAGAQDQLWLRRLESTGDDVPARPPLGRSCIVVDPSGTAFITGRSSITDDLGRDYLTVAYTADGILSWVRTYDGTGHGPDEANAITLDGSGIYVTGRSTGTNSFDYATIKYSFSGDTLWTSLYDNAGIAPGDNGRDVSASASGVFVTGESYGPGPPGTSSDAATLRLDPATGAAVWVARYDRGFGKSQDSAYGIAAADDTVYVTGHEFAEGFDYVTIKYAAAQGETLWARSYAGAGGSHDHSYLVGVDSPGNVYVAGRTTAAGDLTLVKRRPDGAFVWATSYNGPGNSIEEPRDMIVDGSGNLYVTAISSGGPETGIDWVTIKFNTDGDSLWVARHDGSAHRNDEPTGIALDANGDVYVTGGVDNGTMDIATIRYAGTDGAVEWSQTYDGGGEDHGSGVALGQDGSIYVAGTSFGATTGIDYLTIKYCCGPTTAVQNNEIPARDIGLILRAAVPDPFNPVTRVSYTLPAKMSVRVSVFDATGRTVRRLADGPQTPGEHVLVWDAHGEPSGMYFIRLEAGRDVRVERVTLIK